MNDEIYTLAKQVIDAAKHKGLTIATAESCTGGGIGAALTAISGSSHVFEGGIISYSNEAKINLLAVPKKTIKKHGAVSGQTAKAMAEGARKALSTDLAISVTGIAGPTGGSKDKPVGTVWIGLAQKNFGTQVERFIFADKGRENVRRDTVTTALKLLKQALASG